MAGSSPRTTRCARSCATRSSGPIRAKPIPTPRSRVSSSPAIRNRRCCFSTTRTTVACAAWSTRRSRRKPWRAMRPRIAAIANELLDAIEGTEFDLMDRVAAPLPVIVIAEMLGIDTRQQDDFKAWSNAVVSAFFNVMRSAEEAEIAENAQAALDACFRKAIAECRANAGAGSDQRDGAGHRRRRFDERRRNRHAMQPAADRRQRHHDGSDRQRRAARCSRIPTNSRSCARGPTCSRTRSKKCCATTRP